MHKQKLAAKSAIDFIYNTQLQIPALKLSAKNKRERTKAQLFFVGSRAKELYILVGDDVGAKSSRILIEHPLAYAIHGVNSVPDASPYVGSTVKNAARGRRISISNQHTVYVETTDALAKLLAWYSDSEELNKQFSEPILYGKATEPSSSNSSKEPASLASNDEQPALPITANDQVTLELDTPGLKTDEREAVVKVRFGQGSFRDALLNYKNHGAKCWMSGIEDKRLLIASHIKPWSHCKEASDARGNLDNGLLLSALWDAVFDAGLISFDADYKVVASSALSETARSALNLNEYSALPEIFRTDGRKIYLAYHWAKVFENWKQAESMTDGHN
jgi:hypothetical protein